MKGKKKSFSPWKNRANLAGNSQYLRICLPFSKEVLHSPQWKSTQDVYVTSSYCFEKLINYGELNLLSLPHSSWMIIACTSGFWTIQWMCFHWSLEVMNLSWLVCKEQLGLGMWNSTYTGAWKGGSHSCVGKGEQELLQSHKPSWWEVIWDTDNSHRDNFLNIFLTFSFALPLSPQNETGSDRVTCKHCG